MEYLIEIIFNRIFFMKLQLKWVFLWSRNKQVHGRPARRQPLGRTLKTRAP